MALLVGSDFGLISANVVLGALGAVVAFLLVAYLAWETRPLSPEEQEVRSRRSGAGYVGVYGGAADGGSPSGDGCGFGGDGGGSFGGDGGGGGC